MRKFAKFLVPALLLVAVIVSCAVVFASAADENVVYVYSTAAGKQRATDAGIPESQLVGSGTLASSVSFTPYGSSAVTVAAGTNYTDAIAMVRDYKTKAKVSGSGLDAIFKISPLYKAVEALPNGGTIVFLDEIEFELAATLQNGQLATSALPAYSSQITFTSKYGDFDNTANGRLVINHLNWNSAALGINGKTLFKDTTIVYKYESADSTGTNEHGGKIFCRGKVLEIGTGVNVVSQNYSNTAGNKAGDRYLNIYGSDFGRTNTFDSSTSNITIKSGTWRAIYGGGYSDTTDAKPSNIGKANIYVYGGTIESINGGGTSQSSGTAHRYHSKTLGDSKIVVSGGTVGAINGITGGGVGGNLTITVNYPANVTTINYKNTTNASAVYPSGEKTATLTCNMLKKVDMPTISEGFTSTATNLYFGEVNNIHATLNDNVTLKFDYKVTDKITDAMVSGEKVKYYLTIGDRIEAEEHIVENIVDGVITVAAELYATEMNEEVSVKFVIDGKECDTWTETFAGYALEMIKDNAEYAEVVYATLNYGAAAQKKFDSTVADADLANANVPEEFKTVSSAVAAPAQTASKTGSSTKLTYEKTTIVLFTQTVIRHYFTANTALTANEMEALGLVKSGNLYYYQSEGQDPTMYNTQPTVNVDGIVINYSVMNYLYAIDNSQSASVTDADKAVVRAMYDYYAAAVELTRS